MLYDVQDRASFQQVESTWIPMSRKMSLGEHRKDGLPIVLIGAKCDKHNSERAGIEYTQNLFTAWERSKKLVIKVVSICQPCRATWKTIRQSLKS